MMMLGKSVFAYLVGLEGMLILSFVGMSTLTVSGLEGMLILSFVDMSILTD